MENQTGKIIKSVRAYLDMTQDELAYCLGVSQRTLYNYEHGLSTPRIDTWDKLRALAPGMVEKLLEVGHDGPVGATENISDR